MCDDRRLRRRAAAGPVDELDVAVAAEEEADADVAAGRAAFVVVDRVDLAVFVEGTAGGLDRLEQACPGDGRVHDGTGSAAGDAVVVLHLFDPDDVW